MPKAPFRIAIPDEALDRIRRRVADFPWDAMPASEDWRMGTPRAFLRDLAAHWLERFDWREAEARLNALPQYTSPIAAGGERLRLHFVMEEGSGSAPRPLLLLHGWPGTFFEFSRLVEPLAHPERHGGREKDAFTVIVPSLPGYGFSSAPGAPMGPRRMAQAIDALLARLGQAGVIAHGGDWGSMIAGWLAFEGRNVDAAHITMAGWRAPGVSLETDEERAWGARMHANLEREGGYLRQQATRPHTLGYAMTDSPVGVAAWILEKYHAWSDVGGRRLDEHFSRDDLLTTVMIYLVTGTFVTSTWTYFGWAEERAAPLPRGARIERPVALAGFPGDSVYPLPPRSHAERHYENIAQWTDMPHGGHFAALDAGDLLVEDLRRFARTLGGREG
ncbi:MAG: epoxide hydrolase [Alphaproteobacteria bacterium]|nr:epoxide hydrolase [Alphaproteobacteria bacterium]